MAWNTAPSVTRVKMLVKHTIDTGKENIADMEEGHICNCLFTRLLKPKALIKVKVAEKILPTDYGMYDLLTSTISPWRYSSIFKNQKGRILLVCLSTHTCRISTLIGLEIKFYKIKSTINSYPAGVKINLLIHCPPN